MRARLTRRAAAALLAAAAGLALTACGEKREDIAARDPRPLAVALDRPTGPEHAGFQQALDAGHFTEAGLEVELRPPAEGAPPIELLASGEADLATVGERELLLARERGVDAVAVATLIRPPRSGGADEHGLPVHSELVLVARGERIAADPEPIRLLIGALARGTREAVEDPGRGIAALLAASRELRRKRVETKRRVRATLPLLVPHSRVRPFGYTDPAQWREYAGWMRDEGLIDAPADVAVAKAVTNALLPGAE